MKKSLALLLPAAFALFALSGCVTPSVESVVSMTMRHGENVSQAAHEFTPEEEFAIGRAVGARIVSKYGALQDQAANNYVNQLGQALAMRAGHSTPNGYHFLLLSSPEVNAFAAPGGLIFVTTGMVGLVSGESQLAAVLAHEIGHVQNRDAVASIKTSRTTKAATALGADAAGSYTPSVPVPGGSEVLHLFSGAVDDVINTLVVSGYSRGQEYAADAAATGILRSAGYDPGALAAVLQAMSQRVPAGSAGFGSTHPPAQDRLAKLGGSGAATAKDTSVQAERFRAALGKYSASAR